METRKSPTVSQLMNSHVCFQQKQLAFREKKYIVPISIFWRQKKTHIMLIGPQRHQRQFILSKRRHDEWPGWVFFPSGKSNVKFISYQKDSKVPQNKSCIGPLLVPTCHIPSVQNRCWKNDGWKLEGRFFPFWTRWAVTNFEKKKLKLHWYLTSLRKKQLTPRQQHPLSFLNVKLYKKLP